MDEIQSQLEKAREKDIHIKIDYRIETTSVDFLDVTITNEYPQLRTSILHKPATESYIIPYRSDHPRCIHRNIPYVALLHAARFFFQHT